jgi:Spy/CpxP family protein refolding chaperone
MNTRRMVPVAVVALVLALVVVVGVGAQQGPPPGGPGGRGMMMGPGGPGGPGGGGLPLGPLNLTDAQKAQIQAITQQYRQAPPADGGMPALELRLRQAIFAPGGPIDATTIVAEINATQAQNLTRRAAMEAEIAKVLTDDQRALVVSLQPAGGRQGRGPAGMKKGPGR